MLFPQVLGKQNSRTLASFYNQGWCLIKTGRNKKWKYYFWIYILSYSVQILIAKTIQKYTEGLTWGCHPAIINMLLKWIGLFLTEDPFGINQEYHEYRNYFTLHTSIFFLLFLAPLFLGVTLPTYRDHEQILVLPFWPHMIGQGLT